MIFQYHITRITTSAAVYGRARCITFELFTTCSLDMHCMGILFSATNTSSMDVQGVCLSTASSIDGQGVFLSTASSLDVQMFAFPWPAVVDLQGVSPSTASNVNVHGGSTASSMDVQGVPFLLPAVWTCRMHPFFKCRNVGLSSTIKSGTRMNRNAHAGTSPVPDKGTQSE
jgi:hypothetical protein